MRTAQFYPEDQLGNCGITVLFEFGHEVKAKESIDWLRSLNANTEGNLKNLVTFSTSNKQSVKSNVASPEAFATYLRDAGEEVIESPHVKNGLNTIWSYTWAPSKAFRKSMEKDFKAWDKEVAKEESSFDNDAGW